MDSAVGQGVRHDPDFAYPCSSGGCFIHIAVVCRGASGVSAVLVKVVFSVPRLAQSYRQMD